MRDIATAILSGNPTRDVELGDLPSGTDVARLRVASTTRRRSGEEWVERTGYFTVEVFGARARSCAEYLRKGSRVFVEAELDWREWVDEKDGRKREAVTLKARQVLFEGRRSGAGEAAVDGGDRGEGGGVQSDAPVKAGSAAMTAGGGDGAAGVDDVPFQHRASAKRKGL